MPTVDFSLLTTEQRLDPMRELCERIERDIVPLSAAQAAELDRRITLLNLQLGEGREAFEVLVDLRADYGS